MRERFGINVLTLNLRDIYNVPDFATPAGATWQERYSRITVDLRAAGAVPDIVVLQDAPATWICLTNPRQLPDYAALDFLADDLETLAGERYRVAYLIAKPFGWSDGSGFLGGVPSGLCRTRAGRALLYRPSKLRNDITGVPTGETPLAEDAEPILERSYVATSVAACDLESGRSDIVADIDGPLIPASRCPTVRVPAGYAWTRAVRVRRRGEDGLTTRISQGAVFSRFELVQEPGNFVHIYNVHRVWDDLNKPDLEGFRPELDTDPININWLVVDMEARYTSPANPTLYPPILIGDFNVGMQGTPPVLIQTLPRFEKLAWVDVADIDGAISGAAGMIPPFHSRQPVYAHRVLKRPATPSCKDDPRTVWSDHCGVFFRMEPVR